MDNETKNFLKSIGYLNYNKFKNEYTLSVVEPNFFTIKIPNEILNVKREISLVVQHILKEIVTESIQKGIKIGEESKAIEIKKALYINK
jgi:hypothetical protein